MTVDTVGPWIASVASSWRQGNILSLVYRYLIFISTLFTREIAAERTRWSLWTPVGLACGIIGYFLLPFEPTLTPTVIFIIATIGTILFFHRRYPRMMFSLLVCLLPTFGFLAAQIETSRIATPMLERSSTSTVTGKVLSIDKAQHGYRVLVSVEKIANRTLDRTPKTLRIFIPQRFGVPILGSTIQFLGTLEPLAPPAMPGSFDFQRYGFFSGIGGSGIAIKPPIVISHPASQSFALTIEQLRSEINQRITQTLVGYQGSVATALLTGARSDIPRPLLDAMRDSGLAHLLSISGLHMGLVATFIFAIIRGSLALVPTIVLRFSTKKWAAVIAMLGAFAYLLIAGAPVPTLRAFLMTGLAIIAVLLDRIVLSINLVAWAAIAVLLFAPDSLLGPSFQMSFLAVLTMIAAYETPALKTAFIGQQRGVAGQAITYVIGIAATTMIASIAILPAGIYHFNQIPFYGLAANLIAVPITGLWVMPWGVLSLLAMPLGLEQWPLIPMGWGITAIAETAQMVASWPGSTLTVKAIPDAAYALMILGIVWLCLWRRPWRWLGFVFVLFGIGLAVRAEPPDILINESGKLIGIRDHQGDLQILHRQRDRFSAEIWLNRNGTTLSLSPPGTNCDSKGCIYHLKGHIIGIAHTAEAAAEDCTHVDIMVLIVVSRVACHPRERLIRHQDLSRLGTHAIWLPAANTQQDLRVETVNEKRGNRPWVPRF
ncbi:MAG: ComEC/Rec2 family competence protein [Alphaproteobacteria bacterium]